MTRRTLLQISGAIPLVWQRDTRSDERRVYDAVNKERVERGAPPLEWSSQLAQVARDHSVRMVVRKFFGHKDPDYGLLPDRLALHGIRWSMAGENLFSETGIEDPVPIAVISWCYSVTGHFETMMEPAYTHTGVGIAATPGGTFSVAQLFLLPGNHSSS